MKVAYVLGPECIFSTAGHGVKMQAKVWGCELLKRGIDVGYINSWGTFNPCTYDIIHIFGFGHWLESLVKRIAPKNGNIVLSPIIDSIKPKWKYQLVSYIGCSILRLGTINYSLRKSLPYIKKIFVRSEYEGGFFYQSYGLNYDKVILVPLSSRFMGVPVLTKEPFCLTVSSICNPRKNVVRLIKAANRYNFPLVLAGNPGTENEFLPLKKAINGNPKIQVCGFVDENALHELYSRAKVFALPSILEGVGLSALEAASYGCDIVITNLGGPKEYYGKYGYVVDPYDVDDIGHKVSEALVSTRQPDLYNYINENFSMSVTIDKLIQGYVSTVV